MEVKQAMSSTTMTVCLLCGNPDRDADSKVACSICGACHAKVYGISVGYIYPYEARAVRQLFHLLTAATIFVIIITVAVWVSIDVTAGSLFP